MHFTVLPRFMPIILLVVGAAHPQNAAMSKLRGLPNRPKNHATLLLITQSDALAPGQPTQTNTPRIISVALFLCEAVTLVCISCEV